MQIDDLYEDLKDGIRLISLLQIICREKVCRVRVDLSFSDQESAAVAMLTLLFLVFLSVSL